MAVLAREDRIGDRRLVAYVVPQAKALPPVSELQKALSQNLAGHMVHSSYVFLDTLAQTHNGEVNRQALPDPGQGRAILGTPFVPPRTPTEHALATIWWDVLGINEIIVNATFLELGGNPLFASLVISHAISAFRVEIELSIVSQAATVADMVIAIIQHQANLADSEEIARMMPEFEALSEEPAHQSLPDAGPQALTGDSE